VQTKRIPGNQKKPSPLPVYPFRWQGLEDFSYPRDENGVPRVDAGSESGLRYQPVTVAQYGLYNLQQYSAGGSVVHLSRARACVQWLRHNFTDWREKIGAWVFDFDLNFYGLQAPWISGMAQGQGISLLLRYHQHEPLERLQETTSRALQAFYHSVAEGGVVSSFPDGALVFEEFTTQPPSHVLNGHIFALLGIYDYAAYWQDKAAHELFEVSVRGLARNLDLYDTGYWNYYDLHPRRRLASPMYMKVHVQLLRILADLSGHAQFRKTAEYWQAYLHSFPCRLRWLTSKFIEKIRLQSHSGAWSGEPRG